MSDLSQFADDYRGDETFLRPGCASDDESAKWALCVFDGVRDGGDRQWLEYWINVDDEAEAIAMVKAHAEKRLPLGVPNSIRLWPTD